MLLSKILQGINYQMNGNDIDITSIEYDSRKVSKGSLFVAVKGYATDGHLYIKNAVENGAAAVLAEHGNDYGNITKVITDNTRIGLATASANFFGNSGKRLRIIGVTGTNGKTTTTYLIKQIFDLLGCKTGLIGTNQNMIGDRVLPASRTTPESLELHKLLREMEDEGVTLVIMEVSSHSLLLHRTYGIQFEEGIFTNLTRDHLDFHKTMENYMESKALLFENCKSGVINTDDEWATEIKKRAKCPIMTYGIESDCDFKAQNIRLSERGVIFTVKTHKGDFEVRLGIPGKFSVYNALAAASVCYDMGIGIEDIIKGLLLARGVKGRVEVVYIMAPYTVIIDYAHTPDGLENIIKTVLDFAKGRVITVFGCGGDRDATKRPIMGEIAGTLSDYTIITSDNPRTENPTAIINDILKGMTGLENKYTVIENRKDAIRHAMSIARDNDIIILAGKGHETYQILSDRTIDFDEREIVKELFSESRQQDESR